MSKLEQRKEALEKWGKHIDSLTEEEFNEEFKDFIGSVEADKIRYRQQRKREKPLRDAKLQKGFFKNLYNCSIKSTRK